MLARASVENEATEDGKYDDSHGEDESETLSDIDDSDVDVYLHNEEEKHIKKMLWERVNRVYVTEQEAKEAVAAANKKTFEGNFGNCSEDLLAARELAASSASSAEAAAKSRKGMKHRRAREAKNIVPTQYAAEAIGQMSNEKKSLKSKVNLDRLEELFNDMVHPAMLVLPLSTAVHHYPLLLLLSSAATITCHRLSLVVCRRQLSVVLHR
ncbi:hypothetical protein VNO80_03337 [Phaseolus coccineus]|uniref:Brf1 TBP-binding domain-containing protein n=1 Tax=Phaseolus coccineus TaxID=3886 RepID=A0AAN9NYH8_PHACN